ncbi:hypothetical protein GCM10017044_10030 [Kordiimonas sediminis]|uniref:FAS1 domain-containing protein n=1 Tax=Kordiimonas sediminis TaxID=1735581 RepID=A0A919APC9_9PROT|nr:fasciclin domain-containing protein [Kordiimonas sediminis]GHF17622.1 hypothetical protein GCM10017044_10030 [Kordiimonas sediminis]
MTTIAGIATGDTNFEILVAAIGFIDAEKGTDYLGTISDPNESLTVFAPTNAAFGQLAADLGFDGDVTDTGAVTGFLTTLGADTLEAVVLYHISSGVQLSGDIATSGEVITLQGGTIGASELPTLTDMEPDLIDPSLVATDIVADNGVVHVIDKVLLPLDLEGNDAASITGTVLAVSGAEGFDDNGSDFDMLREAVVAAGLADTLDDVNADLTVFAPTDDAFIGLTQALGYEGNDEAGAFDYLVQALTLMNGGDNPIDLLTTILTYHVAGESLQASQVLSKDTIMTLQGGELGVDAAGLTLSDADPDVADPMLTATDIQASNGIIHALNGVLLPADLLQSDGSNDVDLVIGGDGVDVIRTGLDADLIAAGAGKDKVFAGRGDDLVLGGDDRDQIFGGWGHDTLHGDNGNDIIKGGWGHDMIAGGSGDDQLFGGWGSDTFVFAAGDGYDRIFGFQDGEDLIDLSAYGFTGFADIADMISGTGAKTTIDLGDTTIAIIGQKASAFDADDFIF